MVTDLDSAVAGGADWWLWMLVYTYQNQGPQLTLLAV